MQLSVVTWQDLSAYIFIDRKIDSSSVITLKSRYLNIVRFLEKHNLEFNRSSVNQYIQFKKDQGCKNSYLNNVIKVIKYIHEYLLFTYKYDSGCEKMTYFKRERDVYDILTPSECESIYNLTYPYPRLRDEMNIFFKTFYMLLTLTGMRCGEVLQLKWSDVTETIIRVNNTKTNLGRVVPNNPLLNEQLIVHKTFYPDSPYLFPGRRKEGISDKSSFTVDLQRRVEYLGIKKRVWIHLFRHSFCVEMLRHNDVTLVAKLMGHESLSSTLTYSHYLMEDMTNAVMTHSLLREEQGFDAITKRIEDFVDKIVDKQKTEVHIERRKDAFSICIKK